MRRATALAILLLPIFTAYGQRQTDSGLDSLGRQLAAFRAMPSGDPSRSPIPCPPDAQLAAYVGLARDALYRRLGKPDWTNPWNLQDWYKLTHPISKNWRGGGYCSVGFQFDSKDVVERVSTTIAI